MKAIKFIDMFAGIGGMRLGMEKAGHECVGWIEIDKFARKSYKNIHNNEGVWNANDVTQIESRELPKADCWNFGFPCQDISMAGKQKGFTEGKRSSLFFTVMGLIDELQEKDKPKYLFIENVKNLLSINRGLDFAKLLVEMDKRGYDAEWSVLDSSEVVPQHRERIFIIGHLRGRSTTKVFPITRKNTKDSSRKIKVMANASRTGYKSADVISSLGISKTLTATDYKHPQKVAVSNRKKIQYFYDPRKHGKYGSRNCVLKVNSICNTLNCMQGGGLTPKVAMPLKYTKYNKLMQWHYDKVKVMQNTKKGYDLASIGDTININYPNNTNRRGRVGKHRSNTVLSSGNSYAVVLPKYKIRKLTPKECWRLQGFPDYAFNKAKDINSDSQLYKQAGNAVTVPVIYEIAKKMV
ncbi:DNA cytosine methyltransferase [Apilactobacillus timberlakei]|uniref:DNA (cytosine-5-)-methyltransferase n=1 Tax=Apilactobacillus timberlakei TaxID=2008380 RepID=A0ABY2YSW1_9LACO|nr:DNA cytosine methyltransferase [Apilactobacillus timberlakei]TPR12431.1 DNA (cytosine-5-)-methyltransferase [Apilactobacillus timberlakei]TPR12971.1 DNA (cytosine-5-)-methyltransferase [Apilactobacillus timberlakei]